MQNIQKTQLLFFFTFTFLSSQLFAQVKPARIYCENSVFENYILYTLRSDVITDYTPQFFNQIHLKHKFISLPPITKPVNLFTLRKLTIL